MKTIGIVGGIGPESTVDYYRAVISAYRERATARRQLSLDHHQQHRSADAFSKAGIELVVPDDTERAFPREM